MDHAKAYCRAFKNAILNDNATHTGIKPFPLASPPPKTFVIQWSLVSQLGYTAAERVPYSPDVILDFRNGAVRFFLSVFRAT